MRRIRKRWVARLHGAVDLVVIGAVWAAVLVGGLSPTDVGRPVGTSWLLVGLTAGATQVAFVGHGLYSDRPALARSDETWATLVGVVVGTASLGLASDLGDWSLGAWELVAGTASAYSVVVIVRAFLRALPRKGWLRRDADRVVIIGAGPDAVELLGLVSDHPESRMRPVGVIGDRRRAETLGLGSQWLGPIDEALPIMEAVEADVAFFTTTALEGGQIGYLAKKLQAEGYRTIFSSGVHRLHGGRVEVRSLCHEPVVVVGVAANRPIFRRVKRGVDLVVAALGLIALTPVILLIAAAIRITSPGPILYPSRRVGKDGAEFRMWKFRTMVPNAEALKSDLFARNERTGPLFKLSNDPRVTPVGRILRQTSLDEIPQLLNVLRGEMSLVGPRPALPEETAAFDDELLGRHAMSPGVSGLWQVEARENPSFAAYRRLDLHYVENWGLLLDLKILVATAEQLLVSLALAPLRPLLGHGADGVAVRTGPIIDLRDRAEARPMSSELSSAG